MSSEGRGCQRSHGGPGGKDFRFRATWFLLKDLNSACQRESSQRQAPCQRAWPCPNKTLLTITAWGSDHTCRPRLPDPGLENRKSVGAFQSLRPCCDCFQVFFFFFLPTLERFSHRFGDFNTKNGHSPPLAVGVCQPAAWRAPRAAGFAPHFRLPASSQTPAQPLSEAQGRLAAQTHLPALLFYKGWPYRHAVLLSASRDALP